MHNPLRNMHIYRWLNMYIYICININHRGSRTRDDDMERFLNSKLDWRASLAAGTKHGLNNIEFEVADLRNSSFSPTFHCKLVGNWCTTCGKLNFYMYAMQYFPSTNKKRPKKHLALGEVLSFNPWTEKIMANIWKLITQPVWWHPPATPTMKGIYPFKCSLLV